MQEPTRKNIGLREAIEDERLPESEVERTEGESAFKIWTNSFNPNFAIAPLQVHYYSEALKATALILFRS